MEMHCIPQQAVFSLIAAAGCEALEVREDNSVGWSGRWISNTFVIRKLTVAAPAAARSITNIPPADIGNRDCNRGGA